MAIVKGKDYYFDENGYVVLTEAFHLEKGYCCGLGCRHCPYEYIAVEEPRRTELLAHRMHEKNRKDNGAG